MNNEMFIMFIKNVAPIVICWFGSGLVFSITIIDWIKDLDRYKFRAIFMKKFNKNELQQKKFWLTMKIIGLFLLLFFIGKYMWNQSSVSMSEELLLGAEFMPGKAVYFSMSSILLIISLYDFLKMHIDAKRYKKKMQIPDYKEEQKFLEGLYYTLAKENMRDGK